MIAKKHLTWAVAAALAAGTSSITAQNAPITWSVHDITGDPAEVSTVGTVVPDGARNGGTSDRTVNGVVFESVANSGNLFDSLFANDNIGARGTGTVITNSGYAEFMKQGQRSGRASGGIIQSTEVWTSIEFTNLTPGNSYQIQIWAMDVGTAADGIIGNSALVLGDGVSTGDPNFGTDAQILYEASDFGAGQYAIGVFVADATTQTVNVRQYENLNGSPSGKTSDHFSNGWQIRDQGVDVSPPSPAPTVASLTPFETRVDITSTLATDQTGVEYRYNRRSVSGGAIDFTSAWQDSPHFTDTGLSLNTEYFYTVEARDKTASQNTTAESAEVSVTTLDADTTPPTPDPMSFAAPPSPLAGAGYKAITMTAATATDDNYGVEYFFTETTGNPGGSDSGWQDSPTYIDTGLSPDTTYTYTVKARDKADTPNETAASGAESATTDIKGTSIITWGTPADITNDINEVSLNGTLVEARNGNPTVSATVNGVLFDNANNAGDLMANVTNDDNISSRGWGTVVADNNYRGFLRYAQRADDNIPGTDNFTTIEFFNLTPGNTYEIQIWVADNASTALRQATVLGNGAATAPVLGVDPQLFFESVEGGSGQYAIGTFVADAPNQAFNVATYDNLLTTPSIGVRHWCNGWQLRNLGVVSSGTAYESWATGSELFADDTNGDGVDNGLAWFLGASGPTVSALDKLPTATTPTDYLQLDFTRVNPYSPAKLHVEYGNDLVGWTKLEIPATSGTIGDNIEVTVTAGTPDTIQIKIPTSHAADGKLFARLSAEEN